MKEAYGGTFLFQIVILFLLLFTAIMCITINQTKAFAVKDDLINYIEAHDGLDISKNLDSGISEILTKDGYFTTGSKCGDDYTGYSRDGKKLSKNDESPALCIKDIPSGSQTGGCYYEIKVFYKLDLPVISSIFNFTETGKTKELYGNCQKQVNK